MNLGQTSATVLLGIFAAYVIMVNILEIPYKDIIRSPGRSGASSMPKPPTLTRQELEKIEHNNEQSCMEKELRQEFGVELDQATLQDLPEKKCDYITNQLVQQAVYDPKQTACGPNPSNQDIYEKEALFGSEQTNVSQFFSNNPGAFFNTQRHNSYVPDVSKWNIEGDRLYTERVNDTKQQINAYNQGQSCNLLALQ